MGCLVAVVGRHAPTSSVIGWPGLDALAVPASVIRALHRARAREAVLMPSQWLAGDDLGDFAGLVLVGGPDVDPARYGQAKHRSVYGVDPVRDEFETELCLSAIERGMPVLAICRGMQVLNCALGGTLYQHLPESHPTLAHGDPTLAGRVSHRVIVSTCSRLHRALKIREMVVSSFHHQAVDRIGDGLRVVARAPDGVAEAIEYEGGWVVGVQWHPEDTAGDDPIQQRLFDAFAARSSVYSAR